MIAIVLAAVVSTSPVPTLEGWPPNPYVPPLTQEQHEVMRAEAASNRWAMLRQRAAVSNLWEALGIQHPTNWQSRLEAAAMMDEHAAACRNVADEAAMSIESDQVAVGALSGAALALAATWAIKKRK